MQTPERPTDPAVSDELPTGVRPMTEEESVEFMINDLMMLFGSTANPEE